MDRLAVTADAGPGRRRSQLPRIRPEALEEPDFAEIGPKPARHDGQRGPRSGQGIGCLSRQRTAPARPLAALVDVFGVDRGPWMRSRRRPRRPRAGHIPRQGHRVLRGGSRQILRRWRGT